MERAMEAHQNHKYSNQSSSSEAKMWNYIFSFTNTLVLKCAHDLDLPTILHNKAQPVTLSELTSQLRRHHPTINQHRLYRLLRYLAHMNLIAITNDEIDETMRFGLGPLGELLVNGSDKSMVPILLSVTEQPWIPVKDGVVDTERTAFEKVMGKSVWEYMSEHEEMNERFNEVMANHTRLLMPALVSECEEMFGEEVKSLVDVGGGTGTALKYIAKAFPHIKCTLYDLPHVIADVGDEVVGQFACESGDMFSYIPSADAILLKCVLHDWGDKECIEILKQCKTAIPRDGGKVIIVDIVLEMGSKHPLTTTRMQMDLAMMLYAGGKERTEDEWKQLIIHDAGYDRYNIKRISAVQSVIEAFPY